MRLACFVLLLLALSACKKKAEVPTAPPPAPPKLTVLIVIDQLRGDEIGADGALWKEGFKRLRDEGRWYKNAMHTHGRTETAAGHATLGTGVLPKWHGIVDKRFYDEPAGKSEGVCDLGPLPCDPRVELAPSWADRLKAQSPHSRVVALSEKARSASLLGGHNADLAAWVADASITLTGRYKENGASGPLPGWLNLFFNRIASPEQIARIWELPRLPQPFASRVDDALGELDCGHGVTFPHRLTATSGKALVDQWRCTPDSDRSIAETALFVARHMELGLHEAPDILLVSLSAVDVVGHSYGFESLERVAVLTELDRQLGDLLDGLQQLVGPHLLVALSADHGVAPRVSAAREQGHDSKRIDIETLENNVRAALAQDFGPGEFIAALEFPFLTLKPHDKRRDMARRAAETLSGDAAVYKAWTTYDLPKDNDPVAQLMANNLYAGRSGDVAVVLKPFTLPVWRDTGEGGTNHGTPWPYDRHVPVLLWGDGVTPAHIDKEVAVIDLVRTLSDRLGLPVDPHGGQPLP